jgi:hypothetical protein
VLEVATALAGFTVGEAEGLRRAMSRKRSEEAIEALRSRFVAGALAQGVDGRLANTIYDKLAGFSGFGFPKSHSAAFALLAYQSAWLRHHYPAEFLCALLNAQPMGFTRRPVSSATGGGTGEVLPPDVNLSATDAERDGAVRVGLGYVRSVGQEEAEAVVTEQPYADVADLPAAPVSRGALDALVASGACDASVHDAGCRRIGVSPGLERSRDDTARAPARADGAVPELPEQTDWERMLADYATTSLSVEAPRAPASASAARDDRERGTARSGRRGRRGRYGDRTPEVRPRTASSSLLEDETGCEPDRTWRAAPALGQRRTVAARPRKLERRAQSEHPVNDLETLGPLARELAGLAEVQAALRERTAPAEPQGLHGPERVPAIEDVGTRHEGEMVNACGKFPSIRFASGSYSSGSTPDRSAGPEAA